MDTTIDPQVKNLVSAIGRAETGDPSPDAYTKSGASGEYGRYQYMPDTWKQWAGETLKDPNAPMTMENQNKVAYDRVKQWKDQGLNPAQIASKWNSGDENAYKTQTPGKNAQGVYYDTPAYAMKVSNYYKGVTPPDVSQGTTPTPDTGSTPTPGPLGGVADFIGGGKLAQGIGQTIANMGGTQDAVVQANDSAAEIQGNLLKKIKEDKLAGKDTTRLESALHALTKNIGETGASVENLGTQGLSDKEVIGSAVQLGATALPGAAEGASLAGKVGIGAATGYLYDVGQQLQDKAKSTPDAFKPGFGTAVGAVVPFVGAALSKVADKLPGWLIKKALPKLQDSPEFKYFANKAGGYTAEDAQKMSDFVLNKKGFTVGKLLTDSESAVTSLEKTVKETLNHPQYSEEVGNISGVMNDIKKAFPNAEKLTKDKSVMTIIKNVAPENSSLITKVFNGTANLAEQNTLRQELDFAVRKKFTDNPALTFSKTVAAKFSDMLRANVQTTAPETQRIFAEYTKEMAFRQSLVSASKKLQRQSAVGLYDIAAILGGGIPAVVAEKTVRAPGAQIGAAKVIKKVAGSELGKLAATATRKAVTRTASELNQ
jgi:hypothetical protein